MKLGRFWTSAVFSLAARNGAASHARTPLRAGTAALACTVLLAGLAACAPAREVQQSPGTSAHTTQPEEPAMPPPSSVFPSSGASPSGSPESTVDQSDLSITVTPSPGAQPQVFRLVVANGTVGPETTVPDPSAALAALDRYGEGIFFPIPGPPQQCRDVFGGPQVAVVTGTFKGRAVSAGFKRTDSCQTARWQALAPLFGAAAGGTGAI